MPEAICALYSPCHPPTRAIHRVLAQHVSRRSAIARDCELFANGPLWALQADDRIKHGSIVAPGTAQDIGHQVPTPVVSGWPLTALRLIVFTVNTMKRK
jgi:hypothetical protein